MKGHGQYCRRVLLALSLALVAALSAGTTARAGTILTYSGSSIWDKTSVQTGTVPSTYTKCTVRHTQKRVCDRNVEFHVKMQIQQGVFWNTSAEYIYYNDVTADTNFSRNLTKGTYRLYFFASSADQACNISGSFYY